MEEMVAKLFVFGGAFFTGLFVIHKDAGDQAVHLGIGNAFMLAGIAVQVVFVN